MPNLHGRGFVLAIDMRLACMHCCRIHLHVWPEDQRAFVFPVVQVGTAERDLPDAVAQERKAIAQVNSYCLRLTALITC